MISVPQSVIKTKQIHYSGLLNLFLSFLQENPIKYQKSYESPIDFNDIDGSSLTELKEMQQILRDKYTKKSKSLDDEDYNNSKRIDRNISLLNARFPVLDAIRTNILSFLFFSGIKKILEAKLRMSDSQYGRLLDTLSDPSEPLDYTYAQTMMDEIIYQLAKLMFNQGLYIGKWAVPCLI